jgi:hypothetical protein
MCVGFSPTTKGGSQAETEAKDLIKKWTPLARKNQKNSKNFR